MGTIRERRRKDGSIGYTAQIIRKRKGAETYREAATFSRKAAATAWIKNREAELDRPGGIERAKVRNVTLADAIDRYVLETRKDIGRTKAGVLEAIRAYPIASKEAADITSADIVAFARVLRDAVKPQTVQNYLSHLSAIFKLAKPAWGIPLDRAQMQAAFTVTKDLGLTAKGDSRDRRPTLDELDQLMTFFAERSIRAPGTAPMHRIIAFAVFSTRRQDEITRLLWKDLQAGRILVRDMKHPGQKKGNDVWCNLPTEAEAIARAMPLVDARIFPFTGDAISAAFTRACKVLAIKGLRFHDLRHEGVSRLFEMGMAIPNAAQVSGHKSWSSLQRYSHIRQVGDKYADWEWLAVVTRSD